MGKRKQMSVDEMQEEAASRIFIALDGMTPEDARSLILELDPLPFCYKVGLGLIAGDSMRQMIAVASRWKKRPLFLDIKLDDIPEIMALAAKEVSSRKVGFFTVHASSGVPAMKAAVANKGQSRVLAVTVLTSISSEECEEIFGESRERKVAQFAFEASQAGCDGVVCSPLEIKVVQDCFCGEPIIVTPGIRLPGEGTDDHAHIMPPREAILAGANYIVVGRPITKSSNPFEAAMLFVNDVAAAL